MNTNNTNGETMSSNTPSERRNVIQPADWWQAFDRAARSERMSLSEWMGEQCRDALPKVIQRGLSDRRRVGKRD